MTNGNSPDLAASGPDALCAVDQLVEEGVAYMRLSGLKAEAEHTSTRAVQRAPAGRARVGGAAAERHQVMVIGAGQAGLSVGYHLARAGVRFVILDAGERVGDVWRKRWDSLRLFTPAKFDGLCGLPFPGDREAFPTKDQMADYLEAYAARFALPVRGGVKVERLTRRGGRFVAQAGELEFEADQVVVAMSSYQRPKLPAFASELDPGIVQLHAHDYRSPAQLQDGDVLIVGAGNSGAEIGVELARSHRVWLAGRNTGHVPFRINGFAGRMLLCRLLLRGVFHRVLTVNTPIGRKARASMRSRGGPLIRQREADLNAAGIERVARVAGARNGWPLLEDQRELRVRNVIWCTGFHPGFSWIDLPVFDERGEPRHASGVVESVPGLYFVGLHFLHAFSSTMIHGVGRDAERITRVLQERAQQTTGAPALLASAASARLP